MSRDPVVKSSKQADFVPVGGSELRDNTLAEGKYSFSKCQINHDASL
jgi:hypothetical protein